MYLNFLLNFQYFFAVSDEAVDITETAAQLTDTIAQGWDTVWQQTIVNPPVEGSYYSVVWVARWVAVIGSTIFIFNLAQKIFSAGNMSSGIFFQGFTYLLAPIFISIGISNNGVVAGQVSYSINKLILYSNQQIMQTQIASTTFENAVRSMHVSGLAQNQIQQEYERCLSLTEQPVPQSNASGEPTSASQILESNPQFRCFRDLKERIATLRADFEREHCSGLRAVSCSGAVRFLADIDGALGRAVEGVTSQVGEEIQNGRFIPNITRIVGEQLATTVGDRLAGEGVRHLLKPILYAVQFGYTNTLVGGMFLCGMSAPISLAASLIPFSPRTIWVWLIAFFSFGMAIFYYSVLIGTVATLMVTAEAETFSDLQYPLFLGLFAPAISSTLALGGAWAAAKAAQSNGQAIVSAGFSMVASLATSLLRFIK